ncbi:hypothetical protein FKM82_026038 [Ascaphus truei]|uniref:trypsin inhibitor ClTI-1-like n=1 Tax=Ascaphus truei TaxID=8439 RepID=UPI003F5A8186
MKLHLSCAMLIYMIATVTWSVPEIEGAETPNCNSDNKRPGCPRTLFPVCGTDGQTYSNKCVLCHFMRKSGQEIQIKWRGRC